MQSGQTQVELEDYGVSSFATEVKPHLDTALSNLPQQTLLWAGRETSNLQKSLQPQPSLQS